MRMQLVNETACLPLVQLKPWETLFLCLYSPLLGLGRSFSFLILYTVGRTPWTGDQPVAGPLPTHTIHPHTHPRLQWDSTPRSQRPSERGQFMPETARPL
jgi:hypothetical protein